MLYREDVSALRRLAQQALRERDAEQLRRQQVERQARHLQADCEALSMSPSASHPHSTTQSVMRRERHLIHQQAALYLNASLLVQIPTVRMSHLPHFAKLHAFSNEAQHPNGS